MCIILAYFYLLYILFYITYTSLNIYCHQKHNLATSVSQATKSLRVHLRLLLWHHTAESDFILQTGKIIPSFLRHKFYPDPSSMWNELTDSDPNNLKSFAVLLWITQQQSKGKSSRDINIYIKYIQNNYFHWGTDISIKDKLLRIWSSL